MGETWKGLGKMVVIGAAYSGPTGYLMGETNLRSLDAALGTDFVETKDALVNGMSDAASNAWEDVKRGETGEVGESVGQIYYAAVEAVVGSKGAGLVVKGLSTGAKALIGVERLAALTAKISKFANALKQGVLSVVKVGKKQSLIDEAIAKADELMKAMSLSQRGPVLSAIYDSKTGKTFFGQNFNMRRASDRLAFEKFKEDLHPLLKERLNNHRVIDQTGKAGTPGAHSEIKALDEALKARETATGKPITEADLKDFQLHNRGITNHAPNVSVPRCPHCAGLTEGVTYKK